jgi:hypothetical protein
MTGRDPKCVFVANTLGEADIVAAWLSGNGFLARVMGAAALQGALGWLPFNEFGAKGIEVWVLDQAQAPAARQLLAERSAEVRSRMGAVAQPDAPIEVVCSGCGHSNTFSASDRGSVQSCTRCGDFLDVGESDDEGSSRDSITDRARKVMELANREALRFNHELIDTEHILLALIEDGSGVAANVLKNLGVELHKIKIEVESIVETRLDYITLVRLPLAPQARKVVEHSMEESTNLNHNYLGSEHILLGLLREREGLAARALMNLGVTLERAREEVVHLLGDWTNTLETGGTISSSSPQAGLAHRLGRWLRGWFVGRMPSD